MILGSILIIFAMLCLLSSLIIAFITIISKSLDNSKKVTFKVPTILFLLYVIIMIISLILLNS